MRLIKQITNHKFLNIKEVHDDGMGVSAYQFAERLGVNSIAFICIDKKNKDRFLLNHEATPPLGIFMYRAFGGSIDKNLDLVDIVIQEAKEEAGYTVKEKDVKYLGRSFVSTQMNQFCHLYIIPVEENKQGGREPENKCESLSEPRWLSEDIVLDGEDWKAIAIITKAKRKYPELF